MNNQSLTTHDLSIPTITPIPAGASSTGVSALLAVVAGAVALLA